MKHTKIILVAAVMILVLVATSEGESECSLEQSFRCFHDCKMKGHHGICEWDSCSCTSCYYRACKTKCARQGKVGQCHDDSCVCLG